MSETDLPPHPLTSPPDDENRRGEARVRTRDAGAASLIELPRLSAADQRVVFRQSMAALARATGELGPGPLEGIRPEAVKQAVSVALESGLLDDLDWLDAPAAGSALYQLAAALPLGTEQRELGRRVLVRLLAGNAETFAVMATQMAKAGGKGLINPGVAARIALLTELPIGLGLPDGMLSLAIASRRLLAREYITLRSTRSLPDRRLAARLLERATREAVRRASQGDRSSLRLVGPDGVLEPVWTRLLSDREPSVWRHVAVARGLLAPFLDGLSAAIEDDMAPDLTPTEWRRAVAAIGGIAANRPQVALKLAHRKATHVFTRDPGAVAAFVWGLSRAAETEPEAAEELFGLALNGPAGDVADATLWLAQQLGDLPVVPRFLARALEHLSAADRPSISDDGATALRSELLRALDGGAVDTSLSGQVDRTLLTYDSEGAGAALEGGLRTLEEVSGGVEALCALGGEESGQAGAGLARRTSFSVVRDLDSALLERNILQNLLALDGRVERARSHEEAVDGLRDRIFEFLLEREVGHSEPQSDQLVLHFARLRALLHLVDSDTATRPDEASGQAALSRWRRGVRELIQCFSRSPAPQLRRALMATLARSLDAITRSGACDVSDAVLVASSALATPAHLATLSEAAMDPDARALFARLSDLVARVSAAGLSTRPAGPAFAGAAADLGGPRLPSSKAVLLSLSQFSEELAQIGTARSDALRAVLTRFHHALEVMNGARSLFALCPNGSEPDVALALENASFALSQIHAGARARVLDDEWELAGHAVTTRALSNMVSRSLSSGESLSAALVMEAAATLSSGLPGVLAKLVADATLRLAEIPVGNADDPRRASEPAPTAELPAWLPARRTLGAFYVERPLGSGGVGSVFVVTRQEDRHDSSAERFALKVPDYNADAARHLSEAEFLAHFRAEASALMGLPQHHSLARFVSFDLAARPKPILVMELVEGPNLERLVDARTFDMRRALQTLGQVLDGLVAMHNVGIGHLDLKPANVVLRGGENAVLVDFGLAGRNIRPGCGSAPYSPPEIWGATPAESYITPMSADVYAFACLAFETLSGELLMEGDNEVHMVSAHVAHDGLPPRLKRLGQDPRLLPLVELLFAALRKLPQQRIGILDLCQAWKRQSESLAKLDWPLAIGA